MLSEQAVILVCPCCASPVDARDTGKAETTLTCGNCDQQWRMQVDAVRTALHALT